MKKNYPKKIVFTLIFSVIFSTTSYSQIPDYYNGTDVNQTGNSLKTDLAALIINTHTTNLTYTPGVWDALKQTDLDPTNSNNVLLIYGYSDADGNSTTDRTRSKNMNGGGSGDWNREHSYPKSLGNPNLGTSGPGADAHHIRSSDVSQNGARGSLKFADGTGNAGSTSGGWYPGDEWKGDVARMMMYMYLRYGNQCLATGVGTGTQNYHSDMMDIFLKWNAEDPVSQYEINRNPLLEGIQGNRNPFIDNPAFATSIWGGPQAEDRFNNGTSDTEAPTAPTNLVASNTTETGTTLTWTASTDNESVSAYQIFNGTTQITSVTGTTYTVTDLTASTSYTFTVKAIDAASNVSGSSNEAMITTLESTTPPPSGNDAIAFQGYESSTDDTWNYTASPVTCNDNGNDVWDIVTSVGSISSPKTDANFFGIRDLDGNCGTSDGGTLTFDAVDITEYENVVVSFALNVVGYDVSNGDTISYEIFHDTVSQGTIVITDSSPYSTDGWITISNNVPNTVSAVNIKISAKQNGGSDYAGIDDVQVKGTAISSTPSFIINEVDADTPGTDTLEFVEIYDGGVGNASLDGLVIVMYNGSNDTSYGAYDLDGKTTNAEGYFVLGNTAVENVDMILPSNGLQNGADAIALYTGNDTDFESGTIVTTTNLIDALVYDTNDGDDTGLLALLNSGQAQINEDELEDKDAHSSQRIPNGSGGARNTSTYTQKIPTPGTENGAVPPAPDAITIADARTTATGELVTVSGILTVSDQFLGSAYLQDSTGGIAVFDKQVYGEGNFMIGDSITVTGKRSAYNDQVQISTVTEVTNNGTPNITIEPITITLSQLGEHPAELVRIVNPEFPTPGDMLFGNSNYTLTDTSGTGTTRIDSDIDLVGFGQPETCSEIIGVVGRFYQTYQLLPRLENDLPCAAKYTAPETVVELDKTKSLDITTWNIEWFGDETNSPAAGSTDSDSIQKDSVKTVIQRLNSDIYAVEEIADATLFEQMVDELPGYDFILSDATSYPNDTQGTKQQVGFIYKTETIEVVETKVLLKSVHPYYNGGDESALSDYPEDDKTRFFASGRLPFMLTANVTIDGNTQQINIVDLHARANSGSDAQGRYDMRKYDVEALKDSLDAHYSDANLIILGDYNDDVDTTVADGVSSTASTFEAYVNDATNYKVVSSTLSDQGYKSYAFRDNMIDHIMVSNELFEQYVDASVRVHYEFYDSDFTTTSSDHFPVSAQLLLEGSSLLNVNDSQVQITNLNTYPNPFVNYLNIKFNTVKNTNATFLIYNSLGAKIYTKTVEIKQGQSVERLRLKELKSGVYFLKISVNGVDKKMQTLLKN